MGGLYGIIGDPGGLGGGDTFVVSLVLLSVRSSNSKGFDDSLFGWDEEDEECDLLG